MDPACRRQRRRRRGMTGWAGPIIETSVIGAASHVPKRFAEHDYSGSAVGRAERQLPGRPEMRKLDFCRHFVHLQRKPICFDGRLVPAADLQGHNRNLVLRCSRQTEKQMFLVNTILY